MTTIAYRAGVLAADTRAVRGDTVRHGCDKLLAVHGRLYGFCGNGAAAYAMRRWILQSGGGPSRQMPEIRRVSEGESELVVVTVTRDSLFVTTCDGVELIECDYYAVGVDASVAFGALHAGATAVQAVAAACAHGIGTGGAVRCVSLPGRLEIGAPGDARQTAADPLGACL